MPVNKSERSYVEAVAAPRRALQKCPPIFGDSLILVLVLTCNVPRAEPLFCVNDLRVLAINTASFRNFGSPELLYGFVLLRQGAIAVDVPVLFNDSVDLAES